MERAAWTDQRLDDLAESVRSGFARLDQDTRDVRAEIGLVRTDLKAEIQELRQIMLRVGAAMIGSMAFGFLSVFAAILLRG